MSVSSHADCLVSTQHARAAARRSIQQGFVEGIAGKAPCRKRQICRGLPFTGQHANALDRNRSQAVEVDAEIAQIEHSLGADELAADLMLRPCFTLDQRNGASGAGEAHREPRARKAAADDQGWRDHFGLICDTQRRNGT